MSDLFCPDADQFGAPEPNKNGHRGLWFDKVGVQQRDPSNNRSSKSWKSVWIEKTSKGRAGESAEIKNRIKRRRQLVARHGGRTLRFRATSSLAIGMGISSPVENGMVWEPTLGVPYLPGSSVKGVMRAWVHDWLELDKDDPDFRSLFGWAAGEDQGSTTASQDTNQKDADEAAGNDVALAGAAGDIIIFDMLPIAPVQLAPDIMTPHYTPWHSGDEWPADWFAPVPIPFLIVKSDAEFEAAITLRGPIRQEQSRASETLDLAECCLAEALSTIGAGAKTSRGYGRFERIDAR